MAFDVKQVVGDIADDIKEKAQEMLDSSQIDDRIAAGFRTIAVALDRLAGRVDDLDTDEVDDKGNPEPQPKTEVKTPANDKAKEAKP